MRRLSFGLVLLLASPAFADTGQKKEGEYGGVVPGQKAETKPGKPKRPPPKGTLTWIGFEAKDGGAQLFLQSVGPHTISQKLAGTTLVITLDLTRLGTNTWRKIDTRFFDNPLSGVIAKQARKKRGIEVHINFKNPKDAKEAATRTATEADGMFYTYLTFPEGTPVPSTEKSTPATKADPE
jgi:hypothetical protein